MTLASDSILDAKDGINLADPACEPTDEQLEAFMQHMMQGVMERRLQADARLAAATQLLFRNAAARAGRP